MNPSDLTPFGLKVDFLDDGRALLRIGAMVIALSPKQVQELRSQLGVGTVTVRNESGYALAWEQRSSPTVRAGGRNYELTIRPAASARPPLALVERHVEHPPALIEAAAAKPKRLRKPRKKKEIP